MLITMIPLRDPRSRVVGYRISGCPEDHRRSRNPDEETRAIIEQIPTLARLAGRTVIAPVTPGLLQAGIITRFASVDAVWMVSSDALDDPLTRRTVERLIGSGFNFALQGFPESDTLIPSLLGCPVILDASNTPPAILEGRIKSLVEAGLLPLIRGVDDRVTRQAVIAAGASLYSGRPLPRGAAAAPDRTTEDSVIRAITMLAAFSDGRPADATFDAFVRDDPHLAGSLLKTMSSAAMGVRGPRSVSHALTMLGRDTIMERMVAVTARLIGEAAQDQELAFQALRRARLCERVGTALDTAPHPRARVLAGLLSTLEFALGSPSSIIAQRLSLPPALRDVLLERSLPLGRLIDVVDAMEYAWWDDMLIRSERLGIRPRVIAEAWIDTWRVSRDELGTARVEGF